MSKKKNSGWDVVPGTESDIDRVREHCRRMVRRRAAISAGVSAVPIPGVDVMSDVSLFALLVEDINRAFGLSEEQIGRLHPTLRVIAYEAAVGAGGMMIGKLITRQLVGKLFQRAGSGMIARAAAKVVPIAGQIASAAIGFAVFRQMGYQHVDACVTVAQELLVARA
ncbi:MAG: hypothetical protein V4463_15290 [Pseudomonadota bacterium]